jgi:hypothetical protein
MRTTALVAMALVIAACKSGPPADLVAGPDLGRYSEAQAGQEARALLAKVDYAEDQERQLLAELDKLLKDEKFLAEVKEPGIRGVCVYAGGSGGLLIAGGGAKGLASFAGGRQAVPFKGNSVSVGAIAGGQASWGIGLMIGLAHENWFPGEYDGSAAGATAVESSVGTGRLQSEWFQHAIRIVTVGAGLSASAGHVEVTVSWDEPKEPANAAR